MNGSAEVLLPSETAAELLRQLIDQAGSYQMVTSNKFCIIASNDALLVLRMCFICLETPGYGNAAWDCSYGFAFSPKL